MKKNILFGILLLTFVWIVLCESFTISNMLVGVFFSIVCIYVCYKHLPVARIKNVHFVKLLIYPFYLIIQMYLSGFAVIKIILSKASVEVVDINTEIKNPFLRTIMANSITLTPGTITLELKEDKMKVLWLREEKADINELQFASEAIKGKLERILIKAEK